MFSFVVIEEKDKEKRIWLEKTIISEISNCNECKSSENWLINYSTKQKIKDSGLWQVNELYKDGFGEDEFAKLMSNL